MKIKLLLIVIPALIISNFVNCQTIDSNKIDNLKGTRWRVDNLETFYTGLEFDSDGHRLIIDSYADTIINYPYTFNKAF